MRILTEEQRKFLIHINDYHFCMGHQTLVANLLRTGKYHDSDLDDIHKIIQYYKGLINEANGEPPQDKWYTIVRYGRPTKYLKG
jgi:hypothetical protein